MVSHYASLNRVHSSHFPCQVFIYLLIWVGWGDKRFFRDGAFHIFPSRKHYSKKVFKLMNILFPK